MPPPNRSEALTEATPSRLSYLPAALLLEDGMIFRGQAFGAGGDTAGEVVFNTSMTGYQEILTDPSYRAQIVTMTSPHIGNYGVSPDDMESAAIQAAGFIVKAPCARPSNWRSAGSLDAFLAESGVVGLAGIDTRALVRHLRESGVLRGAIMHGEPTAADLKARLDIEPPMLGRDLVSEVTCDAVYVWHDGLKRLAGESHLRPQPKAPVPRHRVVAYDFGIKRNILRLLTDNGCEVIVVPANTPAAEAIGYEPDGFFLSNGPGDPAALPAIVETVRELLSFKIPLFGICLGHQLLARALGADTFKLKFGHRGANQPVKDLLTGKVEITSQNHGFAVRADGLTDGARVSHINLNDDTVAGLDHADLPFFSVQYHPEASPGPHDADYLFRRFTGLMEATR
jgi:carbamoyl-phosphate synthase small subunit